MFQTTNQNINHGSKNLHLRGWLTSLNKALGACHFGEILLGYEINALMDPLNVALRLLPNQAFKALRSGKTCHQPRVSPDFQPNLCRISRPKIEKDRDPDGKRFHLMSYPKIRPRCPRWCLHSISRNGAVPSMGGYTKCIKMHGL